MFRSFTRRQIFAMGGSLLAAKSLLRSFPAYAEVEEAEEISDELAAQILNEDAEPGGRSTMRRAVIKPFWFQESDGARPSAHWPADNVSFDYGHLTSFPNAEQPFEFKVEHIERLVDLNAFPLDKSHQKVLFGLRGCELASNGDRTTWAASHSLKSIRPDHISPRCIIGVWDRPANAIAVFKGSTVPGVDLMLRQVQGSMGCNMLPTGFHQYRVGPHRGFRQPGAFRQQTPGWFHRTKKNLLFAANDQGNVWDDLDGNLPFDNIHAAMLTGRSKPPFYSSAGCQVVAGAYKNQVPTGAWAEFRKAAGLAHPPKLLNDRDTKDDGRAFDYILLTGKEAQLTASGDTSGLKALRFGSKGQAVKDLQAKLIALQSKSGVKQSGTFDRRTQGAVIKWQVSEKLAPTGMVSLAAAASLALSL